MRINVTKSFLPPYEEYQDVISRVWDTNWLTNNGPLLVELEAKIKDFINFDNLIFVGNGTIAIQIALKALNLSGEIITTPFSYCATTTSLLWDNFEPVFVDINKTDFNINADLIEAAITPSTSAILATHVYGYPCEIEKIAAIAKKHNLKVIYDAAHAFGVKYQGKSLITFGDISTCSFHSTKVFHTVEGGSICSNNKEVFEKMKLMRSFGHVLDDYYMAGINGKNSEFHAAMGLCNLKYVPQIIKDRAKVFKLYDEGLNFKKINRPTSLARNFEYNYAYYPVVFESENITLEVINALNIVDIYPRRYFYPSLNKLPYIINKQNCPVSEDISVRVVSLPLYPDLEAKIVEKIINIINKTIG